MFLQISFRLVGGGFAHAWSSARGIARGMLAKEFGGRRRRWTSDIPNG